MTLDYFTASPAYMELNYGMFEIPIKRSDDEVVAKASVRGYTGDEMFSKSYKTSDLAFSDENLRFSSMCTAKFDKQLVFQKLIYWSKRIFLQKKVHTMVCLFLLGQLFLAAIASVIVKLIATCYYRLK